MTYKIEPSIEEMLTNACSNKIELLIDAYNEYINRPEFFDSDSYPKQLMELVSQIAKKGWTFETTDEIVIDPNLTIAQCMEDIGMTYYERKLPPRQYARVKFVCEGGEEYRKFYPFDDDETFIYFGEIPNMKGHCVVISDKDKQFHIGYHIDNFVEWNDEEALIFSDTIPLGDE